MKTQVFLGVKREQKRVKRREEGGEERGKKSGDQRGEREVGVYLLSGQQHLLVLYFFLSCSDRGGVRGRGRGGGRGVFI